MVTGMTAGRAFAGAACAAALASSVGAAEIEMLADPTRPPAGFSAATAAAAAPESAQRAVLQSIMITPQRRSAIISGERVDLGGRFGEAEVVQISESEVVLRSRAGVEILKLYPAVERSTRRTDARPPAATGSPKGR
jgi:MSHA biogenesis protein MshK